MTALTKRRDSLLSISHHRKGNAPTAAALLHATKPTLESNPRSVWVGVTWQIKSFQNSDLAEVPMLPRMQIQGEEKRNRSKSLAFSIKRCAPDVLLPF